MDFGTLVFDQSQSSTPLQISGCFNSSIKSLFKVRVNHAEFNTSTTRQSRDLAQFYNDVSCSFANYEALLVESDDPCDKFSNSVAEFDSRRGRLVVYFDVSDACNLISRGISRSHYPERTLFILPFIYLICAFSCFCLK